MRRSGQGEVAHAPSGSIHIRREHQPSPTHQDEQPPPHGVWLAMAKAVSGRTARAQLVDRTFEVGGDRVERLRVLVEPLPLAG
jgi:hypothetical protein